MMGSRRWSLSLSLLALLWGGCGGGGDPDPLPDRVVPELDAGSDGATDSLCGEPRTALDGHPCVCDTDCTELSACFPESEFVPGGICSRGCDPADPEGACPAGQDCAWTLGGALGFCLPECTTTEECGPGRICGLRAGLCSPWCQRDEDCRTGHCNRWSGGCVEDAMPPGGAGVMGPCLRNEDCKSELCDTRRSRCYTYCSVTDQLCPEDAYCVPSELSIPDWPSGYCYPRCTRGGAPCENPDLRCIFYIEGVDICAP